MSIAQPTWLYKKVDIPKFDQIQRELLDACSIVIKDIPTLTPDFYYITRDKIESLIPITKEYLDTLGILDRWTYTALITGNNGVSLPIHVDAIDWINRSYSLNIPVLNCNGSFTAFYDAKITEPAYDATIDRRAAAHRCDLNTAVEIDRIESSNPCWINISIPHQPIVTHQLPRILAAFRFSPEVHDIMNS